MEVQRLVDFLPYLATTISLVGNLSKKDASAATSGLVEGKRHRIPSFRELTLEEIDAQEIEGVRGAIGIVCQKANVSLQIIPTRLDAPLEK